MRRCTLADMQRSQWSRWNIKRLGAAGFVQEFVPLTAAMLHMPAADGAGQSAAVLAVTPGLLHHLSDKGLSRRLTLLLLLRGVRLLVLATALTGM